MAGFFMALNVSDLVPRATQRVQTRWRRIVTDLPVPESVAMIERLRAAEPRSMATMPPVLWDQAEGFVVRDRFGNQWIDLTSGIMVANAGHGHPLIRRAICDAADKKLLVSYVFATEARLKLLEKLVALAPIDDAKAILFSSGTEATECAISLMRRHGRTIDRDKVGVLSFTPGYHGRTLGAAMASGAQSADDWIERERLFYYPIPFPYCPQCPWGRARYEACGGECFEKCLESLEQKGVGPRQIAGIIGEAMPGWATWHLPADFARAMAQWARRHDVLICFDEVQSGCGRSGRWFAFEHFGVVPDLIALGKGLTSSLAVSAVVGPRRVLDLAPPGEMSSTHSGNPVSAAAALANLQAIEQDELVEASQRTGEIVLAALRDLQQQHPQRIHSVQGKGLFISMHLVKPRSAEPDVALADAVAMEAVRRGVMMFVTGGGFLKIAPPLCIEPDAALEAVDVIGESISAAVEALEDV
jgi:4-aminobutyrate aminotransferase/diaminobutyrate-pyruvate transaminase/4-aminobutyrate aminotransferase/(S)-3-amino-2-methylpropionate transaminase